MQGYLLFWKCLGPFVGVLLIDIEKLCFVITHRAPFGAILRSFRQVHFFAHEIRARKHHAYTQRIRTVTFSKSRDQTRKVLLIFRVPWDRNRDCPAKVTAVGILDLGLERLGSLLIDKRRRFSTGFNTELIFHADPTKNFHAFVNRTEIQLTWLLLDIFPTDMQTHAREMWVCADLSFESAGFVAAFNRLRHPQAGAERRARNRKDGEGSGQCESKHQQKRPDHARRLRQLHVVSKISGKSANHCSVLTS